MSFFSGHIVSNNLIIEANSSINDVGSIVLNDTDSTNSITLKAPATIPASYTLTLPSSDGTNGQLLSTDGNGVLGWIDPGSGAGTVDASNITIGDATVFISTSSGNVSYNASSGKYCAIQIANSNVVSFASGNVVLDTDTIYRGQPGSDTIELKTTADGVLNINSPKLIFDAPTITFNGFTLLDWNGNGLYSNLVLSDNKKVIVGNSNFYINSSLNTSLDIVSDDGSVNLRGDHNNVFNVANGQSIDFDLTNDGTSNMKLVKSGSNSYINFTSTEGDSGIGIRNNSGSLEIKNTSTATWTNLTGFLSSITTVTTNASVSIPAGCKGIVIKANASGGGGGGTASYTGGNTNNRFNTGGGGGGGEYGEIYLNGSNIGSNTIIYIDVGTPGLGKNSNVSSPEVGDDGSNLVIRLNDGLSNTTIVELQGGKGGSYAEEDNTTDEYSRGLGGLGGGVIGSTIANGIGFTIPGKLGEAGYVRNDLAYPTLSYGGGGQSFLGSGGRPGSSTTTINTITDGINGGGGSGASVDAHNDPDLVRESWNGSNGGGGIAYIFFY